MITEKEIHIYRQGYTCVQRGVYKDKNKQVYREDYTCLQKRIYMY